MLLIRFLICPLSPPPRPSLCSHPVEGAALLDGLHELLHEDRLVLVVREVQLVEARVSNGEGLGAPLVLHAPIPKPARRPAGGSEGAPVQKMRYSPTTRSDP